MLVSKRVRDMPRGTLFTALHEAIERYEKTGEETECRELQNYKFLKRHYASGGMKEPFLLYLHPFNALPMLLPVRFAPAR